MLFYYYVAFVTSDKRQQMEIKFSERCSFNIKEIIIKQNII